MNRVALALLAISACTFDDVDLSNTHFRCDAEHACPAGQACVAGACGGQGSGSDHPATADGVACGGMQCAVGMQCCASVISAEMCQPLGTSCGGGGEAIATCDGLEDCGTGMACCEADHPACGAAGCGAQVCHANDDCVGSAAGSKCCFTVPYPWGVCGAGC